MLGEENFFVSAFTMRLCMTTVLKALGSGHRGQKKHLIRGTRDVNTRQGIIYCQSTVELGDLFGTEK